MQKRTCGALILAMLLSSCATADFGGRSGASFPSYDRNQDRNVANNSARGGPSRDFGTGE